MYVEYRLFPRLEDYRSDQRQAGRGFRSVGRVGLWSLRIFRVLGLRISRSIADEKVN